MADAPLFQFERVAVELEAGPLVRDLTTTIPPSGITVVLGPSGSGKTTLLRLCNRLEVPTSGRVLFRGEDIATLDPLQLRRRVGMVFQHPTLFAGTVRDNLLEARGGASDAVLGSALERVDLAPSFLDRPRDELSGGEAQRACLARTLLTEPEVLLMDEPTAALDPERRLGVEAVVRALADSGIAVVWVTHDLEQARRIGDRSIVLVDGRGASEDEARQFVESSPGTDDQLDPHEGDGP